MRRIGSSVLTLYLLAAVVGHILERLGIARCGCSAACWCRRPVFSPVRWVFPWGHQV